MQGQRGAGNSFAETIDLNQGSVSNNNGSNPPTGWNSMLYPMDNYNVQNFFGWHIGESISSTNPNLQPQGLGGNINSECLFDTPPPVGPSNSLLRERLSRSSSGSYPMPLNINLNVEHMGTDDAFPNNITVNDGKPLETGDAFPYNIENNDGASSSFGYWGSSVKRRALDNASSNCLQQDETFDRHEFRSGSRTLDTYSPPLHPPSFSHSEELSLRIGIGRGIASDVFPPISVTETGESSSRNYGVRVNHDSDRFNLLSTRNTMNSSDFFNRHQSPRPISPPDTFEFRPVSNNARTQSQSTHTLDLPRNMPPFASHRAAERGFSSRDEGNSMVHSPFAEIRNNMNLSPENVRNQASQFPSSRPTPQRHGLSGNVQRPPQFYPWAPFPLERSERAGHFPPLGSGLSSSEETMMSSGANQGHHHRSTPYSRSLTMELPGDDVSGWHALAADIDGRHRLVSEIHHVLNAMRRGDNLRDEDYMLFDPFINGIAELHDRHRDMRLDVDNMSYEELLALEEHIGDVNTGLSEEAILRTLKQRKHLCLFDRSLSTLEPCSICREDYVLGDNVGELDCGHDFHTDCVKQWLTLKNICPICKMTALGTGYLR